MRLRRARGTGGIETRMLECGIRHRARLRLNDEDVYGPTRDNVIDALDDLLRLRYPQPDPPPKPELPDTPAPRAAPWRGGKKNECINRTNRRRRNDHT